MIWFKPKDRGKFPHDFILWKSSQKSMYILPKPDKDQMHIIGMIGFLQFSEKQSLVFKTFNMIC